MMTGAFSPPGPLQELPKASRESVSVIMFAAILLFTALVRLPALVAPANLSQDATEYIDIARNVAAGEGLTLKIRGYFFGDGYGVPYPSQSLRSPLFPLLMGFAYRVVPSYHVFQWFNFGLFLINMALLALLFRATLPPGLAAYALLLAGMTEPFFLTSIFPWAEQTALVWLLTALLMASAGIHRKWGGAGALLEGLVCAMASLSRPEYLLVGALFLLWLLWRDRCRWEVGVAFLIGFLLPLGIVAGLNYQAYGRTFFPGEYLFHSRHYASYFAWSNSGRAQGTLSFLYENWVWILGRILRNAVNYSAKLIGWKNLFLLALALPLVLLQAVRGQYDRRKEMLAIAAAAFFCSYCLIWAGMDRERYLLAVTPFWLPLCLSEANRLRLEAGRTWVRRASLLVMAANLPLSVAAVAYAGIRIQERQAPGERFYARENPAWSNPDAEKLSAWITANLRAGEVLCMENPFLFNYQTGCIAVVIPEELEASRLGDFLQDYHVSYFINNTVFTRRSPDALEALERAAWKAGAREAARCGTYRIFRMP